MTYIEFFDRASIENMCGCLLSPPERVILVGHRVKQLAQYAQRYRKLMQARGHEVEFVCWGANRNSLQATVQELSELLERYDDCVLDLTGGEDLYLVAVGIVMERYAHKHIQAHRFNISNGVITDCDQDGKIIEHEGKLQLTVAENIQLYGGDMVPGCGEGAWDMNGEFRRDIDRMWELCRSAPGWWNAQIGLLQKLTSGAVWSEDGLTVHIEVPRAQTRMGGEYTKAVKFMDKLCKCKLLKVNVTTPEELSFTYKNHQIKRSLAKTGQVLELVIYKAALDAEDEQGEKVYNDVANGVSIDWDGVIHSGGDGYDTVNEIDVMMMHGAVPVFVSCKNGGFGIEELYKLNAVAERFGGPYGKKVLVATAMNADDETTKYLEQRMIDMNIRLMNSVQDMNPKELNRTIRSLWCNG